MQVGHELRELREGPLARAVAGVEVGCGEPPGKVCGDGREKVVRGGLVGSGVPQVVAPRAQRRHDARRRLPHGVEDVHDAPVPTAMQKGMGVAAADEQILLVREVSKEKAKAQGIDHLVYPRFTRTVLPRGVSTEKMHPNEAYEIIRNNDIRDEQILADVRECILSGRTPIILSKYKDHSEKLYERVKAYADHVFLMTGNYSKREHRRILSEMQDVNPDESMILVATGSLIGEGFDYPRLDTLIMATPVSFKGVVEQYAGRLNRDYAGKEKVIVYDYVDSHIPMFDNMYAKRLRAYKQIGYDVCGGITGEKQSADAIFDSESYQPVFQKDLSEAQKSIVISSPAISAPKVHDLISLIKEKQSRGITVTIVTWEADAYGFGDSAFWMQLHEEMRQAGFYMKLQDESCERFAVIDQEIVWYGGVNLLAKSDAEQSIMRVPSKKIAAELMELTFGSFANEEKDEYHSFSSLEHG